MNLLAIEIGGTKLQIVAGDENGRILARVRLAVAREEGGAGIRRQIEESLARLIPQFQPTALGVGFGGPVDWQAGVICCSHQIEGWADFPLAQWLRSITGKPVFVDNDANVASLGEAHHGAAIGFDPVFYVTLGSGVGGGLVVEGKIFHGARPGESEIGHVRLDKSGRIVESSCSGWAVDQKVRAAIKADPAGPLARLSAGSHGGEARFLAAALREGDRTAHSILDETAEDLAFGLSHVLHLVHPEIVILGGGLSLVGEPLLEAVQQRLTLFTMEAFAPGPAIKLAKLGEDSVPVGALTLARRGLESLVS